MNTSGNARPALLPRLVGRALNDVISSVRNLEAENARYHDTLQQIATSHPIDLEPLATAHSLRAHKALRPDCDCTRCVPANATKRSMADVTQDPTSTPPESRQALEPATDCRCDEYRSALERIAVFYRGGERATESMLEMRAIAKRALSFRRTTKAQRRRE